MLRTHSVFFSLFRTAADIVIIGICWIAVYFIRFNFLPFSSIKGVPDIKRHIVLMLPVICICYIGCLWAGLYKSKRIRNLFEQFSEIIKASVLSGLLLLSFFYYISDHPYSRKLLLLFMVLLFGGLLSSHLLTMVFLRFWRGKGYNLRYYAVIGAGEKGRILVEDIRGMRWLGLKCLFFIDAGANNVGNELLGIPVYRDLEKLPELINMKGINEVYLTLSGDEARRIYPLLQSIQYSGVTVRIVPDWGNLVSMSNPVAIPIGSQLLFSEADSPLSGKNLLFKQFFDFVAASAMLVIISVPMLIIAFLIRLSSKGPVFYRQTRVGMDQKEFEILKFRTMRINAEQENGPQWSSANDDRCTLIGKFLRKTSLDELPQLINVICGEMSLVGPRPERPYFVKQFSEEYKKYVFRHKVKAGMTGWAQIHGFRGNSSLRKRLIYDLYYVKNWSFGLDLWILLCTPRHVIKGENAH